MCVFLVERENKYVSDKKREKRNSTRLSVSALGGEMPEPKKAFQRHLLENVVAQEKQMERLNKSAFSLGVIHHPTPGKK